MLTAPFPYFGGKRLVADDVWARFGDVDSYNEPFAGSLAVLLGRPHAPRVETVNDRDCYIANFFRAVQRDPDQVAHYADHPVNEADLHAFHVWLVSTARARAERVKTDAEYCDVEIAGRWVWGQCLWIGSRWCATDAPPRPRRWQGGGQGGGSGVHAPCMRDGGLYAYMRALAVRLRYVRVCCGDWQRVLTPSLTTYMGTTAVFLDPPYDQDARAICYAEDHDVSEAVKAWALAHGDNPKLRIAYCGYETGVSFPPSWACVPWKAHGGYSRTARGVANRDRERIWYSPHCLTPQPTLWEFD